MSTTARGAPLRFVGMGDHQDRAVERMSESPLFPFTGELKADEVAANHEIVLAHLCAAVGGTVVPHNS